MQGYKVEYDNEDQICIIPMPGFPLEHSIMLWKMYGELGYKWWLRTDYRNGYILSNNRGKENED